MIYYIKNKLNFTEINDNKENNILKDLNNIETDREINTKIYEDAYKKMDSKEEDEYLDKILNENLKDIESDSNLVLSTVKPFLIPPPRNLAFFEK